MENENPIKGTAKLSKDKTASRPLHWRGFAVPDFTDAKKYDGHVVIVSIGAVVILAHRINNRMTHCPSYINPKVFAGAWSAR